MNITQIRNATIMVEIGKHRILVDPMLSPPSTLGGFRLFRGERRKNPLVELPDGSEDLLACATEVLVTHEHPDHMDKLGIDWIKARGLQVWCSSVDAPNLRRKGLDAKVIGTGSGELTVEVIPGQHGHGLLGWLMGPVAGFYLSHPKEASVYITGDTVLTSLVKEAIQRLQPQVVIAPAGSANFGIGKDLIFSKQELIELIKLAPGHIIFNHLDSLDHCLTTRAELKELVDDAGLGGRVLIPEDGEGLHFAGGDHSRPTETGQRAQTRPGFQKWLTAKFAGT